MNPFTFQNRLMPMPGFEYQAPDINRLAAPIQQGMDAYQKQQNERFDQGIKTQQMELQRRASNRADMAASDEREQRMALKMAGIAQVVHDDPNPSTAAANWQKLHQSMPQLGLTLKKYGIDPADYKTGAKLVMGEAGKYRTAAELEQEGLKTQQMRGQVDVAQATLAQIKSQTPEWRAANAGRFGLTPGTPEHMAFVISGQYAPKSDTFDLKEGEIRYQQIRQPDGSYKIAPVAKGGYKIDATTKKAIDEADDFVAQTHTAIGALNEAMRLNKQAYSGWGASQRAGASNNMVPWSTPDAQATTNLENVITNQALQSLRATFGGNPTEGERKILLEVAGSVNQPAQVRSDIYARAMQMAQQRLTINQQKAAALRGGTYYNPGGQPPAIDKPMSFSPQGKPGTQPQSSAAPQAPAVAPGQVYSYQGQNWQFVGGDPGLPESWRPLVPTGR